MRNSKKWMVLLLSTAMVLQGTPARLQAAAAPSLSTGKMTLKVGNRAKLKVKGKGIRQCRYRSQNKKIATVSQKGVVVAKKKGSTRIRVTVTFQKAQTTKKKKLWCKVIVKAKSSAKAGTTTAPVKKPVNPAVPSVPAVSALPASGQPVTSNPEVSSAPNMTAPAADTKEPAVTAGTSETEKPGEEVESEKPTETGKPEETAKPTRTAGTSVSEKPSGTAGAAVESEKPSATAGAAEPGETQRPVSSHDPDIDLPFIPVEPPKKSEFPQETVSPTPVPYQSLTTGGAIWRAADIQWEDASQSTDLFQYCLDAGGHYVLITGLTKEGKNQEELTIPAQIENLPVYAVKEQAVYNAKKLQKLTIEDGVKEMAVNGVARCKKLQEISIPASLQFVVWDLNGNPAKREIPVFQQDTALTRVEIAPENPWYQSSAEALYSRDGRNLICWFPGNTATCSAISAEVCCIEPQAFMGNTVLEKIVVPDSVQEIGRGVFRGCAGLVELKLPERLSYCGDGAFAECESLTEIHIPEGIVDLGSLIEDCRDLETLYLPDSMKDFSAGITGCSSLEKIALSGQNPYLETDESGCYSKGKEKLLYLYDAADLTEYTALDSLREIAAGIFRNANLETVNLNQVERIGKDVFNGCENLQSVFFGAKTKTIGDSAFYGCVSLTEVTLPDGVDTIGTTAFSSCIGLEKVNFEGKVTKIGTNAFSDCTSLEEFDVPEGITYLDSILEGCESLTRIRLSSTVRGFCYGEEMDFAPFYDVPSLQEIEVDEQNKFMKMNGKGLYTADGTTLLYYCEDGATQVYQVVSGTVVIGAGAFRRPMFDGMETALSEVALPESVKEIREGAFEYRAGLEQINLPDSLQTIGTRAFNGCRSLRGLTIRETGSLESIESAAFQNCISLEEFMVPESVKLLGADAFNKCVSLQQIEYKGTKAEWQKLLPEEGLGADVRVQCSDGSFAEDGTEE